VKRQEVRGFDTEDMVGLIGPKTINAVRAFQLSKSLRPDGCVYFGLLKTMPIKKSLLLHIVNVGRNLTE
jgi:peptidoglycan hydrolase-like protein with peptidoglycan-binding domain